MTLAWLDDACCFPVLCYTPEVVCSSALNIFMVFCCHELYVKEERTNSSLSQSHTEHSASCCRSVTKNTCEAFCAQERSFLSSSETRNTGFSSWDRITCVSVDQQPSPCMSTYNDSDFYADSCWICFIFLNFWKENMFSVMQHTPTNFPCMSQNVTGTLWCIIISSPVTNHCLLVWSKCSIKWSVATDATEPNDANIKSL